MVGHAYMLTLMRCVRCKPGIYRHVALQCTDTAGWLLVQIDMPYGGIPVRDTGCANVLVTGALAAV